MLIFEKSRPGCFAKAQAPSELADISDISTEFLRKENAVLPEVSEMDAVRHFTQLSQKNFSIDTHFYPLGSCTMKYNPRGAHKLASLPGFLNRHPYATDSKSQGYLSAIHELQEILLDLTGMKGISLATMAGAQGEFAGVAMIKAYHTARNDHARTEIIVPDAAHGTNPASAVMCGYKVVEIPTGPSGDIDIEALKSKLGPQTAGIMLTNPSTLGVFERKIHEIADLVHEAGGLLYYDGANLNAIMGKTRPGDMGFDVLHLNLHKTFATPHGGGGPGSGPVAVGDKLKPHLPVPFVTEKNGLFKLVLESDLPGSIGRLSAFAGNAGILLRAYAYARILGRNGLTNASEIATLNANYMMKRLEKAGFTIAFPERRATHEFILTLEKEKKEFGVGALDFAKGLLDEGFHAPTMYFPLIVPECLLIEPTETESKRELDSFIDAMVKLREIAKTNPERLHESPINQPVKRLDDVKAARNLDLVWKKQKS
jgi:glycine dehydrogenase subunit 2